MASEKKQLRMEYEQALQKAIHQTIAYMMTMISELCDPFYVHKREYQISQDYVSSAYHILMNWPPVDLLHIFSADQIRNWGERILGESVSFPKVPRKEPERVKADVSVIVTEMRKKLSNPALMYESLNDVDRSQLDAFIFQDHLQDMKESKHEADYPLLSTTETYASFFKCAVQLVNEFRKVYDWERDVPLSSSLDPKLRLFTKDRSLNLNIMVLAACIVSFITHGLDEECIFPTTANWWAQAFQMPVKPIRAVMFVMASLKNPCLPAIKQPSSPVAKIVYPATSPFGSRKR